MTGEATRLAQPDRAEIDVGVTTQAPTSGEAARQNAQRLDRTLTQLRAAAGSGATVRTVSYSISPDYRHDGRAPTITGYTATNIVRVVLDDLDKVGEIIDVASASGANRIHRLQFTLKDEEAVYAQALGDAAKVARSKAGSIAAALGVTLAGVRSVSEGSSAARPLVEPMFARAEAAVAPTPIEPGPLEVRAVVTMTFDIGQP